MGTNYQSIAIARQLSKLINDLAKAPALQKAAVLAADVAIVGAMTAIEKRNAKRVFPLLPAWVLLTSAQKTALLAA